MNTAMTRLAAKCPVRRSNSCEYRPMHDSGCWLTGPSKGPTVQSTLEKSSKLASDTDCEVIRSGESC